MAKSYLAIASVKKIEVIDDGNPNGGVYLWAHLGCPELEIDYYLYDWRKELQTGQVIEARLPFFYSLFHKSGVTNQQVVRFNFNIASGPLNGPLESNATAGINVNLSTNSPDTTWWIETHANRLGGGTIKIKINFDLKTIPFNHETNRVPCAWGCSEVNGGGSAVDLTAPSRKINDYPIGEDGTRFLKGVWRTDYNQLGSVGNDQISSLVGGAHGECVVILHEHAFNDPAFSRGRRQEILLRREIVNLPAMGPIIRFPPQPTLDNQVSAVEVAVLKPPPIH